MNKLSNNYRKKLARYYMLLVDCLTLPSPQREIAFDAGMVPQAVVSLIIL